MLLVRTYDYKNGNNLNKCLEFWCWEFVDKEEQTTEQDNQTRHQGNILHNVVEFAFVRNKVHVL